MKPDSTKKSPPSETPMMKQYWEAKKAYPNTVLLFRMGDFYEMFHDDAKIAARVLNLALTSRNGVPMAGFPHHQVDMYVGKLISNGFCAAICEQTEDPKQAQGLVKREVLRVVTPGTLTEDALLDPCENNYLAAAVPGNPTGLAWVDISTGRFFAMSFPPEDLLGQLARIDPTECLMSKKDEPLPEWMAKRMMLTDRPAWAFEYQNALRELTTHFGVLSLEGFGFHPESAADAQAVCAAGVIIDYLKETQKSTVSHIDCLTKFTLGSTLEIDEASRRSLEIVRTLRDGRRDGSLVATLDKTITAPGDRQLADWMANPLVDIPKIVLRQDAVAELLEKPELCREIREILRNVQDLERPLSRICTGRGSPRDLRVIAATLSRLPGLKTKLQGCESAELCRIQAETDPCAELTKCLFEAIVDEPPALIRDGGVIRGGYHAQLDEYRELIVGGRNWISRYQAAQIERTGISSLKIGYNKVYGYHIEITNAHRQKEIPEDYIRRQTLKGAERYVTEELKEYEEKVLTADEKAKSLEYEIFNMLLETAMNYRRRMQTTAAVLAELDVLAGFAELARQRNYCRPEIAEEPVLEIADGRHPVLDIVTPDGAFVPNDVSADPREKNIMLITGPNMAGKSTYIRQIALLTLMAQIGSFIPAKSAKIGIADRIFARVGASDEIARGQSTFMVEMTETARILNTATQRSLLILDEIGRGTSTYDGISLAWAILEYTHGRLHARTFFATHYHELTDLAQTLPRVKNLNVAVREWADEVVFLHKIVEGAADKSYGIHVARLAGVPAAVVERAKTILAELEDEHLDAHGRPRISISRPADDDESAGRSKNLKTDSGFIQLTLFGPQDHPLLDEIREINPDQLTPFQALQKIQNWRNQLFAERK